MAGCYGNDPEDRARERELNAYLDRTYGQDARIDERVESELEHVLNDEIAFNTMNQDYEIVSAYHSQIMRALRELDDAIKGKEYAMDAVFTALSQIQDNIKRLIRDEAERMNDEIHNVK